MQNSKLLNKYLGENKTNKSNKYKTIITKILLSLIVLFSSLIFTSISDDNLVVFKKYVFEDTFNFMEFKNIYDKYTAFSKGDSNSKLVMSSELDYESSKPYLNGESLKVGMDVPVPALSSGIVVFVGEKEGYNKTVIIQGSDGYDIWYGNLENVDINIYDYIDKEKIIGSASDEMYLQISKDSIYYTYEKYKTEI